MSNYTPSNTFMLDIFGPGRLRAVMALGVFLWVALLAFALGSYTPISSPAVGIVGYGLDFALLSIGAISLAVPASFSSTIGGRFSKITASYVVHAGIVISFAGLCASLYAAFGGFADIPHAVSANLSAIFYQQPFWNFAGTWYAATLTFGTTQLFGIFTSPIRTDAPWSTFLLVVFCIISGVILYSNLINIIRAIVRR